MDIDLSLAMEVMEDSNRHAQNIVMSLFHKFLDRSVHNPEFLEPHDSYFTELSPEDVAFLNKTGRAAADVRCPATESVVNDAQANVDHRVWIYIPSLFEADTLATRPEMFVRETVKPAALRRG